MPKWSVLLVAICLTASLTFGQKNRLLVEGSEPNIYLIHTVTPRENFYSIGRMYNISAKQLASYNNLQFANGLLIGQSVKIPLTPFNFTQTGEKGEGQVLVPVYHVVQPHEGLYRVSIRFHKVPLEILRKWNHLRSDELSVGTELVIGYLKVSRIQSPLASESETVSPVQEDDQTNPPPPPVPNTDQSHERMPPVKVPSKQPMENNAPAAVSENQPEANPPAAASQQPQDQSTQAAPVNQAPAVSSNVGQPGAVTADDAGGFFKKSFDDQSVSRLPLTGFGKGGTFKSTSGWQDKKYYAFSNDAAPGTYIKVTVTGTQKSICAKVLDAIPDIKQNEGLTVIISNSAAAALGLGDGDFDCSVNYIK